MSDATKVLLVDDDDEFRKSTAWLLQTGGLDVENFARPGELLDRLEAFRGVEKRLCVITDVRMQEMSGLDVLDAVKSRGFFLPVVVITGHGDVPLAVEAMRRGAIHFLQKPLRLEALLQAVDLGVAAYASLSSDARAARTKLEKLTQREREVLDLVVASKPNKLIADELGISIKTVELHRANMMNKLDVGSLPELMKLVFAAEPVHG